MTLEKDCDYTSMVPICIRQLEDWRLISITRQCCADFRWLHFRLIRAYYYTAVTEGQGDFHSIKPLVDWLDYNGYSLVTKPVKEFTDSSTGRYRRKGNMDIELAIDMLEMAGSLDHAILFSGDGDFRRLVEAVQRRGVRVTVISTLKSSPSPIISDDLRRQADVFVDLGALRPFIERNHVAKDSDESDEDEC